MNDLLDIKLSNIDKLKWLPFVGSEYFNNSCDNRLMIIGESHYLSEKDFSSGMDKNLSLTRDIVDWIGIKKNYGRTRFFQNLYLALFQKDKIDLPRFWEMISFYNFVQRPMKTRKSRPSANDFINGWEVFFELVEILKPNKCIFIGTSASKYRNTAISKSNFTIVNFKKAEKISRTRPRILTIKNKAKCMFGGALRLITKAL
ncbi:hypothetical protein [Phaeodactylibacter xiamenensis]|uniref:hypothetical protein n=1 Tax=Phaeodactylibacter xiamenensis TaxID=1524460 RepID=UPI003BA8BDE9